MTVWIVVSILVLVLSPLAWLRPSRRQSGRMALRMEARRMGLAMQLASQEGRTGLNLSRRARVRSFIVRVGVLSLKSGAIGNQRREYGSISGVKSARMNAC